jgi:hypothetical protein
LIRSISNFNQKQLGYESREGSEKIFTFFLWLDMYIPERSSAGRIRVLSENEKRFFKAQNHQGYLLKQFVLMMIDRPLTVVMLKYIAV